MGKLALKENYLNKLYFLLSFYFNDKECLDIVDDYDDWFRNELANGRTEAEICACTGCPDKIVSNLRTEYNNTKLKVSILMQNFTLKLILYISLWIAGQMVMISLCDDIQISYILCSFVMNLLFFLGGVKVFQIKKYDYRGIFKHQHIFISIICLSISVIYLGVCLKLTNKNIAKMCVFALILLFILSVVLVLYFVKDKILKNKADIFVLTIFLFGFLSTILSLINQSHLLYNDEIQFVRGGVLGYLLYVEMMLLCIVYTKKARFGT